MAGKVYKSTKITRPAGKSKNQYSARSEFEQLADASRDAIRILNKDFTIRYVNRAYAEMTRVDQNDVVGKKCWELFYSPLCHTSDCRFQRIINGEETFQVEIERDGPEGVTIRCIVTVSPLFDRKHNLIGVIEHFHDISACRRMEEQVRESEDRYRAMIELGTEAGEAIVMLQDIDGMEGIQTFVNSRWLCITGYAREELIGKSFFDLVSPSNRADLIDSHRKRVSGNPMSGLFEMMIIDKNGAEIPIELTGACTHYQGKSADVLYIRDITKRKKNQAELKRYQTHLEELVVERTRALKVSEKRYQCLFQNIPVAIFEVDHSEAKKYIDKLRDQGITNIQKYFEIRIDAVKEFMRLVKVRDINKEAVDIYQAENKKEVFSFFNAKIADQKHFYESYKCIIDNTARGVSKYSYIEHIPTMKGEWHYNLLKFIPAAGCEGTLSRMLVSVFDITEQKNLEHNLKIYYEVEKSLREKLEQEIKQQLEFTKLLVHELKTPLTPLIGASETLADKFKDGPYAGYVLSVYYGARQLASRVDELLDLAKGEVGQLKITKRKVNPLNIIQETMELMRPETKRRHQHLKAELPESLKPIWADAGRMGQILNNLITNAMKFTPEGGTITITARETSVQLIIEVIDNGIGMSPKNIIQLFRPYRSIGRSSLSGLGLGLPLCKMLVELHNGTIEIKSKIQQGTRVILAFPINSSRSKTKRREGENLNYRG